MRIAYLDTFSGISGDMTLGAFVSAGVSLDVIREELRKLPLAGYRIEQRTIVRSQISAVKIDVVLREEFRKHGEHAPHAEHRAYQDIAAMIEGSDLRTGVKERAHAMFRCIAEAEARIHGTTLERIHFHEVGAVDSIVDITGIAICLETLGIETVFSRTVPTGSGAFIETQHGTMPVPAPATLEILRGHPITLTDIPHELTTPTGAAVIAALSSGPLDTSRDFVVERTGYGAGGRDIPGLPNLLRVIIGRLPDARLSENLVLLETNIDDMNPEVYPWIIERLLAAGAHDAYLIPVLMKKGRPGHLLAVTCSEAQAEPLSDLMLRETTTTGIRIHDLRRRKLPRETRTVETQFGPVVVKAITRGDQVRLVAEHEECRRIASERGLPLIDVYRRLEQELG